MNPSLAPLFSLHCFPEISPVTPNVLKCSFTQLLSLVLLSFWIQKKHGGLVLDMAIASTVGFYTKEEGMKSAPPEFCTKS